MSDRNAVVFQGEIRQAIVEGKAIPAAATQEDIVAALDPGLADDMDMVDMARPTQLQVDRQRFLAWQATCRMMLERNLPSVFPGRARLLDLISNASPSPRGAETVLANLEALEARCAKGDFDNGASAL